MDKTPIASSRQGNTKIITSSNYECKELNPKSIGHTASMDTQYWNRLSHSQERKRIGYKY